MKTLIWILTAGVLGLWSLIAWGVHALVSLGGNAVANNADWIPLEPEAIEWASWLAAFGTDIGGWLVIGVWAIVSAVILALGFLGTKLVPATKAIQQQS
jgi:hypothetical protein